MKLRIADRILVGLVGLLLLASGAGLVAQIFFQADLLSLAERAFASKSAQVRWALIGIAAALFLLGMYCVLLLFRHRKRKDRFVLQKNDSGELAISLKALESMVQKCVDQHEEIQVQHMHLETRKDGLLIQIRGSVAGGVSIPLTVENMQKQIRQYVTACSGVDIKGIRVQIDESGEDAENAPFAIAPPPVKPLLKESEEKPVHKEPVEAYVSASANTASEERPAAPEAADTAEMRPASAPPIVQEEEEDDRPLHQRLFSQMPEPCIYPEPPAADTPEKGEEESADIDPENAWPADGKEDEPLPDTGLTEPPEPLDESEMPQTAEPPEISVKADAADELETPGIAEPAEGEELPSEPVPPAEQMIDPDEMPEAEEKEEAQE
ncbi:MAG: alkaline shock response membrane anchor protein AmaP [Clostridia bacterium]|nr:alkaline shock response membrane anchor protein AmaP [Clostridia bacterium]